MWIKTVTVLALIVAVLAVSCAPSPSAPSSSSNRTEPGSSGSTPKRIAAGILGDPYTLSQTLNTAGTGSIRGVDEVEKLIAAALTIQDGVTGANIPQLAEDAPTLENGQWKVFPDGRMETTWRLKSNARWHDGTPVSTADLLFTTEVGQDQELALLSHPGYKSIESVEAMDDRTVVVRWKQPYIEADRMFSHGFALPLPKHLLGGPYVDNKAGFLELPYWTSEFVGTGPFKLREFARNSHMIVQANDQYVLGRPPVAEITVRFMSDPNVLIAALLAGDIELSLGRGLSLEQAIQVSAQWQNGKIDVKPANWVAFYAQHLTPNPPAIGDVRFRRALLHAMDREQMSQALQDGRAPVAHSFLWANAPEYPEMERHIVKYPYDLTAAARIMEGMGFTKGANGFYQDATGQPLAAVEARTNAGDDLKDKMLFATADYWNRFGIRTETMITPRQIASDRELRATYPGFDLVRQPYDPIRFYGPESPLPENRFRGNNRGRYINPELDSLIDRYYVTIPSRERLQIEAEMLAILTSDVAALGVLYTAEPILIGNRLINVANAKPPEAVETWNAHVWDVR